MFFPKPFCFQSVSFPIRFVSETLRLQVLSYSSFYQQTVLFQDLFRFPHFVSKSFRSGVVLFLSFCSQVDLSSPVSSRVVRLCRFVVSPTVSSLPSAFHIWSVTFSVTTCFFFCPFIPKPFRLHPVLPLNRIVLESLDFCWVVSFSLLCCLISEVLGFVFPIFLFLIAPSLLHDYALRFVSEQFHFRRFISKLFRPHLVSLIGRFVSK